MDVVVGRIGRAHGLAGEVTLEVRTDDPQARFAPGVMLLTDPPERGPLVVASVRWAGDRLFLRFTGADGRTAAEALRNTILLADLDPAELPDDPDEFYDHQLTGCSVVTEDGGEVGVVAEMLHLPGQDLLSVRRPNGREVLIPFVGAIVPVVDLAARRLVVTPPVGLLEELDEPRPADTGV